jgi:hypothetical protein
MTKPIKCAICDKLSKNPMKDGFIWAIYTLKGGMTVRVGVCADHIGQFKEVSEKALYEATGRPIKVGVG